MRPQLEYLVEQLWAGLVDAGLARVVVDPEPDPAWTEVESYWLVPDQEHARMLVPRGDRTVTARAVANYRGLRLPHIAALRSVGAWGSRLGVPISRHTVSVQVLADRPTVADDLPLARIERALGCGRLYASIGVRTGDNRKATLALVDGSGRPVGYAKVAWDAVSDELVRTEIQVVGELTALEDAPRPEQRPVTQVPRLLAALEYYGHPILVSEPLPVGVRVAARRVAPPTSGELYALLPVVRHGRPADTHQLRRVRDRLVSLGCEPLCAQVVATAERILSQITALTETLPITSRWHGDLTPWNAARDPGGGLWVWDWESSEPDVLAGMDALHWAFSKRRLEGPGGDWLCESMLAASPHLLAAGVPASAWPVVAAAYALVVVERACDLAVHHGDWHTVWISEQRLGELLAEAQRLLAGR